ncbi:MAG: EAL domain-containing protein [Rhodobacteraceae bacterium]|nr:EAL domain-containing protein [Paracoccaceae bacterium]
MDMTAVPHGMESPLAAAVARRQRDTVTMVRDAVERKSVRLAFQPVIQSARPDRVAFYEGLIRILDPVGRVIPARDFIDAVETQELGRVIDCLALEHGIAALRADPALRLSINMSARSIGYPRWTDTLNAALAQDHTVAARLILEITESSAIVVPEIVQVFMADLQDRGISFALDDFGAGYTAFRYFKQFCFDILKIDGQFIRGIAHDPDNQVMVQAMMAVGQHFEMFTVAESVESAADAAWLTQAGVDCLQGYYFGIPTLEPEWNTCDSIRAVG